MQEHSFLAVKYGDGEERMNSCGLIIQRATENIAWETDPENKNVIKVFNGRERQVNFQDERVKNLH